ncbi:MAG: transcriptional regulator NrdR, partial [Bifidobacterium sp.]|nr:transcriptional regulator NrdR [Bifidobacterium sp.]
GRAILKPLRELDEVAYLRFASVYRNFSNLEDFQQAIDTLRAEDQSTEGQTAEDQTAAAQS